MLLCILSFKNSYFVLNGYCFNLESCSHIFFIITQVFDEIQVSHNSATKLSFVIHA